MKKSRLHGKTGPVCFKLEDDEPFPDISTADSPFLFLERGGRKFRISFRSISVSELGSPGRDVHVGTLGGCNSNWIGQLAFGGDDDLTAIHTRAADGFPAALENLIQENGDALDEDLQTLRRLARKFHVTLPDTLAAPVEADSGAED